jgi:hypothetical protein
MSAAGTSGNPYYGPVNPYQKKGGHIEFERGGYFGMDEPSAPYFYSERPQARGYVSDLSPTKDGYFRFAGGGHAIFPGDPEDPIPQPPSLPPKGSGGDSAASDVIGMAMKFLPLLMERGGYFARGGSVGPHIGDPVGWPRYAAGGHAPVVRAVADGVQRMTDASEARRSNPLFGNPGTRRQLAPSSGYFSHG